MYDSLSSPHETMPILIGRGSPVQTPSGESQVPHTDSKRKTKMFKTQLTYCCEFCKLLLLDVLLLEVKKMMHAPASSFQAALLPSSSSVE
jgi:hypothetical protein